MSTQHTPGPWIAQGHDGPISIVSLESEPQQVIAQMIVRGSPTIRRTAKANARLLAAAPDLLAALKAQQARFMNEPNPFGHDCDWCGNCVDAVNGMRMVAIAKAEEGS